ncbi:hypothetical protein DGo_PB0313 (plasmid) [Deinococcus gobiensis I-0]|uniref:Uncharacterized protein n=1 Tax=Deinococcus gobiensis (strain DSM 21396 / JCM 16679 / CGMCC 1.7299 / I-0) TaxID=745776 RepID=H8H235_DEIGI|nr:hypothetical protein DGo_PB0313 [Deinococcus gobiensis I-0]
MLWGNCSQTAHSTHDDDLLVGDDSHLTKPYPASIREMKCRKRLKIDRELYV